MKRLAEWMHEVSARLEPLVGNAMGLATVDGAAQNALSRLGYPGVLPLWAGSHVTVGLLALPAIDPAQWPCIVIERGEAATLAATAATALPRYLMQRRLSNLPSAARQLADRWQELKEPALELHLSLGGTPVSLQAVAEVLTEERSRDSFQLGALPREQFEAAHSALARAIDPSPDFKHYADWFDAVLARPPVPVRTRLYGLWARQALCWAYNVRRGGDPEIDDPLAPMALVEPFAGLDTGFPIRASWSSSPAEGSSSGHISAVADMLPSKLTAGDSVQASLVKAIRQHGPGYDGYAHAEAVVALDERGEPERAWGALHSAAWWMAQTIGEAPPAILDGARLLCDRHGWDDLRWVVDRNAGGSE